VQWSFFTGRREHGVVMGHTVVMAAMRLPVNLNSARRGYSCAWCRCTLLNPPRCTEKVSLAVRFSWLHDLTSPPSSAHVVLDTWCALSVVGTAAGHRCCRPLRVRRLATLRSSLTPPPLSFLNTTGHVAHTVALVFFCACQAARNRGQNASRSGSGPGHRYGGRAGLNSVQWVRHQHGERVLQWR